MSKFNKQSGFTIVELLIVIVVIGILAALVITTFTGIQQKGRNTERTTDIKAVHSQLEAYYAKNGVYPTLAQMNDAGDAFIKNELKGLDLDATKDPKGTSNDLAATSTATVYGYAVAPDAAGTADGKYTLTATLEGGGTFVKESLNN